MDKKDAIHTVPARAHEVADNVAKSASARADVAKAMSYLLSTIYVVYQKTLFYHWNVTGPHFASLHRLFEEQYTQLQATGDLVAERIRALGHYAPGTMAEFISLSSIEEDRTLPASSKIMVDNLLKAHEACSMEAHRVMKVAEEAEDDVTADMMVDEMNFHDKSAWMLRSIQE